MLDGVARLRERLADGFEVAGGGLDLDGTIGGLDVLGARLDGGEGDLVLVIALAGEGDGEGAARLELPSDGAVLAEAAARARELVANGGDGAVAVVGDGGDEDGRPAGTVALVADLDQLVVVAAAGSLGDGAA